MIWLSPADDEPEYVTSTSVRTRFLTSVAVSDLTALAVAVIVASLLVFDTPWAWQASLPGSVWPMLGFLVLSMVTMSVVTWQMSGPGVPRPTYGRMVTILGGTVFLTAGFLVFFRDVYFSRAFLAYTSVGWLVLAGGHRAVRRQRPWIEQIGVITNEKELADDLNEADHAQVKWVLDPAFDGPIDLPKRDVTLAVDLRAVLSDRVAQYLSSCDVAGYSIRPFSRIYEEHTGRVPLVHVAEGWEISAPLLEVAHWLPGKRFFDVLLTVLTSVLWVPLGLMVAVYVKVADPGFSIFRQERVGLNSTASTMFNFRTMGLDAAKDW